MDKVIGFYGGKMFPFHMGHLNCIIRAAGMVDELYVILFSNEKEERRLTSSSKIRYEEMTPRKRLEWISKSVKDIPGVKVAHITEGYGNWKAESEEVIKTIGRQPDYIFSSENSYDEIFKSIYPGIKHVIFDRSIIDVSGTLIREEGPYKHWDKLPKAVQNDFVKKVVIVGTESCGKSTLTLKLAKAFNTEYVHEFGRDICEEFNGCDGILPDDIYPTIAYGHKMLERDKQSKANKLLFIDSEAVVTQFYSNLYNNINHNVVDEIIKTQKYDLWIYLEPDVKWVDDGLRVHGTDNERYENNENLKKMLMDRNIDFVSIDGDYANRFNKAYDLAYELIR